MNARTRTAFAGPAKRVFACLFAVALLLAGLLPAAFANSGAATGTSLAEAYEVREFRDIDREYVQRAVAIVNTLVSRHYGSRLSGDPQRDLELLQRLLDTGKVAPDDLGTLQSLGVALGELLRQQRALVWVRYIDGRGASRALQLKREPYFLYPVTAISRRAAVGAPVNLREIYERSLAQLDDYVTAGRYR